MAKKIQSYVKLQVAAGMANPSPPVGPALGQKGVNIIEFCKRFNSQTEHLELGLPIPVIVTVYVDRTFDFVIKSPPASVLLKKAAGIDRGSGKSKINNIGKVTKDQIIAIAKTKINDMTGANIESMSRSIQGTAFSMGLLIEDE